MENYLEKILSDYVGNNIDSLIIAEIKRLLKNKIATPSEVMGVFKRAYDGGGKWENAYATFKGAILPGDLKEYKTELPGTEEDGELDFDLEEVDKEIDKVRAMDDANLAQQIAVKLEKIAYMLGTNGEHAAALKVEKTIYNILNEDENEHN